MKLSLQWIFYLLILSTSLNSQIKSGPMLGAVELRTAYIWCEVLADTEISIEYWKKDDKTSLKSIQQQATKRFQFRIYEFYLTALEPGTQYEYQLIVNKKLRPITARGQFTTQVLWNYRMPAPDFSFLAGSCSFFNESIYDRPGRPYGGDSSIFQSMSKEKSAFMLWLGDNWYYREVDYNSEWGLWYRPSKDRSTPVLQALLKAMSHYAIWDDHDFGPNNSNKSYVYKKEVKHVFNSYWCNPARNSSEDGNYTQFTYNDVDFFLMDARSFRSSDNLKDSINNKANPNKVMWGSQQLDWLKNQLARSRAPFKIIANGTPILNTYNKYDCMVHFVNEYNELFDFIIEESISGVLFFTGDRHHSEICSRKLSEKYTIYEILSSPLTSGIYKLSDFEKSNPNLLLDMLVEQNNYTRVSVSGNTKNRKLKVEFMDVNGTTLKTWEINEQQLRF